jgi:hypothetical protein
MSKYKIKTIDVDTEEKSGQSILLKLNKELSKAGVDAKDVISIETTKNDWLTAYYRAPV